MSRNDKWEVEKCQSQLNNCYKYKQEDIQKNSKPSSQCNKNSYRIKYIKVRFLYAVYYILVKF